MVGMWVYPKIQPIETTSQSGNKHLMHTINPGNIRSLCIILMLLYTAAAYLLSFPNPQGTDFYPIRIGTEQLLSGNSPYSEETSNHLKSNWDVAKSGTQVAALVAYPAPFLVALSPIIALPPAYISLGWFCLMSVALGFALYKTSRNYADVCTALLFYPLFHAFTLQTSSMLWLAILLLCLFNVKERSPVFLGLLLALLPLKPQVGLLFFPIAIYYCWRENRRALAWMCSWSILIWSVSFALLPDWIGQWLRAVEQYQEQAANLNVSYMFAILLVLGIGLPLPAFTALASLAIFPLNDIYSTILLCVFFRAYPYNPMLMSALSLGMISAPYPNSAYALVVFVWIPTLVMVLTFQIQNIRARIAGKTTDQAPLRDGADGRP